LWSADHSLRNAAVFHRSTRVDIDLVIKIIIGIVQNES